VPDRDLALEAAEVLLVEHLGDETHVAQHRQPAAVGDRDPRGLLATMLECEETEEGHARDVPLGRSDAENPAHG
jgi:hypothetical protein